MDAKNLTIFTLIAATAAFWGQFKVIAGKIFSIFVRTDSVEVYSISKFLTQEVMKDCSLFRWGNRKYVSNYGYIKKYNIWGSYLFLQTKSFIAFYKGRIPLIVSESSGGVKITYFFKTFPYSDYLEKAYERYIDSNKKEEEEYEDDNFYVTQEFGGKEGESSGSSGSVNPSSGRSSSASLADDSPSSGSSTSGVFSDIRSLGDKNELILVNYSDLGEESTRERKEYYWSAEGTKFLKAVEFWKTSEKWYNDRQIPWRRGCLLSGIQGGGKSRLVLETAKRLKIPLYKMNISNMSDKEFSQKFESAPYSAIVLIEDVCSIFHGRENVLAGKSLNKQLLSFDTLINTISGVKQKNGVFVVMTANHPEKLDFALTRTGRLDEKIELKEMCEEGRRFVANNILCDWPELIEIAVKECDGYTASDFEDYCVRTAIEKHYLDKNETETENKSTD